MAKPRVRRQPPPPEHPQPTPNLPACPSHPAPTLTHVFIISSIRLTRIPYPRPPPSPFLRSRYLGAAFDVLLNLLLTWCLTIFIDAVSDMQTPFGGEQLDMPGLSYVCASAELSLRMVHRGVSGSPESRGQSNKILGLITAPLDREAMLKTDAMVAGAAVLAKAESGRKEEEEEDDE